MPETLITSRTNPRVKQLRAAFAGNARLSGGLVAIEGEHLVEEALRSGISLKSVFLSERADVPEGMFRGVEVLHLPEDVFASAVDTQSPQGIAALLEPPGWELEDMFGAKGTAGKAPLVLVAAALQDPGNLGTLIRSAEAFGASGVLTTRGTVSEWNQKVLRASAGSVFRVPVVEVETAGVAELKSRSVRLLAAVADDSQNKRAVPVIATDLTTPCALMIGNEGAGLSVELLAIADERVTIPMPGRIESLNAAVAGSLLLYEAARQRATLRPLSREGDI